MVVEIELVNRSGVEVDAADVVALCRTVLAAEGIDSGDLGVTLVGSDEVRSLKREHLGIDEPADVLSFPIDGRDEVPPGVPDSSATSSSARRWSARPGAGRWFTGCCTCSATTTATRWSAREDFSIE